MYHVLPSGNSAGCSGFVVMKAARDQFPSHVLLMQEMQQELRSLLSQAFKTPPPTWNTLKSLVDANKLRLRRGHLRLLTYARMQQAHHMQT